MSDQPEPKLTLTVSNPTLNSLALLVELADHISVDGETVVESGYGGQVSISMPTTTVWIPEIDWDATEDGE